MFLLSKLLPLLLLPLGVALLLLLWGVLRRRRWPAIAALADPLNWIPSAKGLDSSSRALREAIGRTLYRAW